MHKCKWCGAEIAENRRAEYCTHKCYRAAWRTTRQAKPKPQPKTRPCRMCGKEFVPSQKSKQYCSPACRAGAYKPHPQPVQESPTVRTPNLDRTLKELNAYNQKHGTCLSYGQWMGGVRT